MKNVKLIISLGFLAIALFSSTNLFAQNRDTVGSQNIREFLKKYQTFQSKRQLNNARRLNEASTNSADYDTPLTSFIREQLPIPTQTQALHPELPPAELQRVNFMNQLYAADVANRQEKRIYNQGLKAINDAEVTKQQVGSPKLNTAADKERKKRHLKQTKETNR